MTVPGKGGRPRKWASQRDRQRAWRARQTGQPEPAVFTDKVDDGDLLATALGERDALADELADAKQQAAKQAAELRRELDRLGREHEALGHRHDWLEQRLDQARTRYQRLEHDHENLRAELHELRTQRSPAPSTSTSPPADTAPGGLPTSRAQRRQAERDAKRRRR